MTKALVLALLMVSMTPKERATDNALRTLYLFGLYEDQRPRCFKDRADSTYLCVITHPKFVRMICASHQREMCTISF